MRRWKGVITSAHSSAIISRISCRTGYSVAHVGQESLYVCSFSAVPEQLGQRKNGRIEAGIVERKAWCYHATWVRISGPLSVSAMVCSKWADGFPSSVTTVHPSERI